MQRIGSFGLALPEAVIGNFIGQRQITWCPQSFGIKESPQKLADTKIAFPWNGGHWMVLSV